MIPYFAWIYNWRVVSDAGSVALSEKEPAMMSQMPSHVTVAKPRSRIIPESDRDRQATDAALLALARVLAAIAASRPTAGLHAGGSHAA